jgi:hypothetical protein
MPNQIIIRRLLISKSKSAIACIVGFWSDLCFWDDGDLWVD